MFRATIHPSLIIGYLLLKRKSKKSIMKTRYRKRSGSKESLIFSTKRSKIRKPANHLEWKKLHSKIKQPLATLSFPHLLVRRPNMWTRGPAMKQGNLLGSSLRPRNHRINQPLTSVTFLKKLENKWKHILTKFFFLLFFFQF